MCGRYLISPPEDNIEYAELLHVLGHKQDEQTWPSGLIVPTLPAPAITGDGIRLMRFGIKKDFLPKILINARSETITMKPMFSNLFSHGMRCLLPATAFYEPSADKAGRKYLKKAGGMIYMAGLFDQSEGLEQFVIITCDADEVVALSHARMPLLLNSEELQQIWLNDTALSGSLLSLDTDAAFLLEFPAV